MRKLGSRSLALLALAAVMGSAAAQTLTGIVWYTTDVGKHYTGGYANTYGGDLISRNLYVSENQAVGTGSLLNSANLTTTPTRIEVNLSTPGTYNFDLYCNDESSGISPFWGLNLFFDHDDLHPGISAWNVVNNPGFQGINSLGTPTLDPYSMGLVQTPSNGNNVPIYFGGSEVTLTTYNTWSTTHYNVDRVDNFTDDGGFGNGTKDQVIEVTLKVTPVPEPLSMLVLGGSSLGLMLRRKLKRSRS